MTTTALGPGPDGARTQQWWQWKHRDNPFGESLVLGAFAGAQLVGVRAFLRWDLRDSSGHIFRCARAVDTATHPDWQGQGIFRALTLAGLEELAAQGVSQVFNTPNAKSGAGYLTMGWRPITTLYAAIRPQGVSGLAKLVMSGQEQRKSSASSESSSLRTAGEMSLELAGQLSGFLKERSGELQTDWWPEVLLWRFGQCPVADYRLVEDDGALAAIVRLNRRKRWREAVISLLNPRLRSPMAAIRRIPREERKHVDYWVWRSANPQMGFWGHAAAGFLRPPMAIMNLYHRPMALTDHQLSQVQQPDHWCLEFGDLELL
ncbi:MAG: GNAT family N-acetyltransferase [Algiphilus sp.]|nr:GNAT family N-acetyltransferase [Algiphilus sp.]